MFERGGQGEEGPGSRGAMRVTLGNLGFRGGSKYEGGGVERSYYNKTQNS